MSDNPFHISDEDYADYELLLLQSPRGRAFLSEHAKRNRCAATKAVLSAIGELRAMLPEPVRAMDAPRAPVSPEFDSAQQELGAIASVTERATDTILTASEEMNALIGRLRANGADPALCGALADATTRIFSACTFQDITGQRTTKVLNVLRYLEQRVGVLMDDWGLTDLPHVATKEPAPLLHGPSDDTSQADVDRLFAAKA